MRENYLASGNYFHIFSRSIAKYTIFNNDTEFNRMLELIDLCRFRGFTYSFSRFKSLQTFTQVSIIDEVKRSNDYNVGIVAFCLMPTHLHFIIKQTVDDGITQFIGRVLNSYTKFFNISHRRSGPLWASRFQDVPIESDEQLLHLTRYIHLNPFSAGLVEKPEDWEFSSYREYIDHVQAKEIICEKNDLFVMGPKKYKKFVDDHKSYQRELSIIKSLLIDNYTG